MSVRRSLIVSAVTVAVVATVPVLTTVPVQAAGTGSGVSYTLEGCRASATVYPVSGPFICPDADYTTGNLGGGWNEFDLVPGRVTVHTGNSAPATQDISFDVAVDSCSDTSDPCTATPGYDRLSTLTLNGGKSSGSCGTASVSDPEDRAGKSLFRQVDITGIAKNANCVYDFFARLAIGSHAYPGSSLHFNLTNTSHGTQGIGSKEVSIPVKQISPFVFEKTETAVQGSDAVWTVTKEIDGSASFNDTCLDTTGKDVTVTVSWDKTVTGGDITVTGTITLGNTAHRPFNVDVSDQLFDGLGHVAGNEDGAPKTNSFTPLAASHTEVFSDVWSPPDNVDTAYSDVASATLTDPIFGDTVDLPDATAEASLTTNPPDSGDTAVITDVEALTDGTDPTSTTPASDYTFTVTSVSGASGTLYSTYDPGDPSNNVVYDGSATTGPLTWVSEEQKDDGSVEFDKTINVTQATEEDATLHDTATITPDGQTASHFDAHLDVSAAATVEIDISKKTSIPLDNDNTFTFNAYGPGKTPGVDSPDGSTTVKVPAGSNGEPDGILSDPGITGLDPGVKYLVDEPAVAPFLGQSVPDVEVDLPDCSTTLNLTNENAPATAKVEKITDPLGSTEWTFTLTGTKPNGGGAVDDLAGGTSEVLTGPTAVVANTGYADFASTLDIDGATYTITETAQTHWDNTDIDGDFSGDAATTNTTTHTCTVTIDLTAHSGGVFECSFTNVQESKVTVVKTQDGGTPTNQYSFRLCPGTSLSACGGGSPPSGSTTLKTNNGENPIGTLDFGYHAPGDFVICELAVPAGTHSSLQDAPYNGTLDGATGNVCLTFTLGAGSDKEFDVDNVLPKGNALTIGYWKHWNSVNVKAGNLNSGNKLMDTFLPISLGPYVVDTAAKGVAVLSLPSMKWAENGMAAQLLAAKLNVASGALTCAAITTAISHADSLLNGISYDGPAGVNVVGNKHAQRADFVSTASSLDKYNNNILC